jgi:hypothetical protein
MSAEAKRVLLIHSEDCIAAGPRGNWDLVVDLGCAPGSTYADWSREAGCPVVSLSGFREPEGDLRHLAEVMRFGMGRVLDETGLDWWDLISLRFYEQMLEAFALQHLFSTFETDSEICVSRGGFHAGVAQALSGRTVNVVHASNSFRTKVARRAARLFRLRPRQALEIFGDKYDGDYRLRRHFVAKHLSADALVLLPSAYGNASRTALAYACAIPETKFLLVATRQSGRVDNPPSNVVCARLAAFVSGKRNAPEIQRLLSAWKDALSAFAQHRELSVLARAGCFDSVPEILQEGLCIRDAWTNVFASNQISAVLCADEMNWNTRIPLLLARSRGIPAIACHHGALDFRYSFRATSADRFLVKGRMERDYMHSRGVPERQIETGAPPAPQQLRRPPSAPRDAIVFFSEPYEVFGGRARGFYREILPPLAELACQHGKELILKLHPYESRRERRRMAEGVLSSAQRELLRVVDDPLHQQLLDRAWFGVTINSTAAVECALSDAPVFLCRWLDFTYSGYSDQFIEFGAAQKLSSAQEIGDIPHMLASYIRPNLSDFSEPIRPDRLRELLAESTTYSRDAVKAERILA